MKFVVQSLVAVLKTSVLNGRTLTVCNRTQGLHFKSGLQSGSFFFKNCQLDKKYGENRLEIIL